MKKSVFLVLAVCAAVFAAAVSSADDESGMMPKDKEMMGGKKMGMGMMMGPMMMKSMMEKTVTATSDGGVVVLSGNKLTKFDKDLKLVGEAEVKVDMDAMKKDMDGMMKMCPMMKGDKPAETADGAPAEADSVDHAAHH